MNQLRRGEYQAFTGGDARFLYLVPSAAVVRLDDLSQAVLQSLEAGDQITSGAHRFAERSVDRRRVRGSIDELLSMRAIHSVAAPPPKPVVEKPKRRIPLADTRPQCDEQVQSVVWLLLRVRRRPDHGALDEAAVHERSCRQAERGFSLHRSWRFAHRQPHLLRRRDAPQLQDASDGLGVRARARRVAGQSRQRQPDDERHAAARRGHRLDRRQRRRRHGVDRRRARAAGQVPHVLQRHGQL